MMTLEKAITDYMHSLDCAMCLSEQFHNLISKMKELYPGALPTETQINFLKNHKLLNDIKDTLALSGDSSDLLVHLSHKSFAHEFSYISKTSYERSEFLGDSVLGLIVTDHLVSKFPELKEGELSKLRSSLVNEETLFKVAGALDLEKVVLVGKGELKTKGHLSSATLSDIVESLMAYSYSNKGLEGAKLTFNKMIHLYENKYNEAYFDKGRLFDFDSKSKLQEVTMKIFKKVPTYDHEQLEDGTFNVSVVLDGKEICQVHSTSKKKGEREAAKECLKNELYK